MSDVQTTEFLRLIKVSFDISLNALKAYANEKLIKPSYGDSLIRFLDKKKHFFYHKWQSKLSCCNCSSFVSQKKELPDWIFYKLYEIKPEKNIKCNGQSNLSQVNGVKHQYCLCRIISHQNLSLIDLDVSVICFLLKNCGLSNLLINQIDDIAKVRNILCHPEKGAKSFSKAEYGHMWKTLENSTLSLAKEIGVFYFESVKDHLATIKKHGVDLDDVIHHLKEIKDFNTKMRKEATDQMQKVNDSILLVQAELTAKGEEQTLEIQRSISESTANVLDGQQDILEKVHGIQAAVNYNASEMNQTTEEHQKIMNYVQTGQANVSSIIGKESHDIKNLITTTETTVEEQIKDNAQEIKKEINKSTKEGGEYLTNVVSTSENRVCNIIQTGKEETMTHVTCVKDEIVKETKKVSKKFDGMSRGMKKMKRELRELKSIVLGKCTEKCNNFTSEVKISERLQRDDRKEMNENRILDIEAKVISDDLNEEKVVQGLTENIAKEETKETNTQKLHICSVKQKCIELKLSAYPGVFESPDSLRSAVRDLIHQLQETGEVDTNKPGTMYIDITVNSPLTKEEHDVALKVFAEPCSSEEHFDAVEVKLKQGLTRKLEDNDEQKDSDNDAEKEWETSNADCQAVTHDDMDVNITDVLGKMVKKEAVQTYAEDFEIAVGGIKFSVTFKGLPHSLKTTNDDDTVPNEKTDYCFLGWTWVCPKQWNLPKMVSVLNTELLDSSDWFQIHFAYVGVNGQLEIQTRTQEHVFRQRLGLESAVLRFLGKIVEACDLEQSYSEEVSVSVVFHSGTIEVSGLTFGKHPEKTLEKRKGLTRKLEDNDEQKDSDNDEEKEWETSSVDCQEPELKKRKTYTKDLTGDHQSEKVTTDLTSTEDHEISFDINETLKKLGKLKLIDFKINEGEKQRRKLKQESKLLYGGDSGDSRLLHKVEGFLSSLKHCRKLSIAAIGISPGSLLQKLSYQRKQNAAGTKDLDFLDMNFGIQCDFCQTQNKDDISGRCGTCSEILCNKCLVQHRVDHSYHSYDYVEDILHGYKKTTEPFSFYKDIVDMKCLTIDTLVIVYKETFLNHLKLSIFDLTGKLLTTKPMGYGDKSHARIAVIDPTTMAILIPPDVVLIANYINTIINTKDIKTSPGMTGGIASINSILYLAYKTGIKVFTLTGEEITSINIPDITLLYTVSNRRLLCVYHIDCGQSKTMGYIDIMNNSMLPLDKLPFHPDDVAVDNEGNILFVEDGVVWQANSDGSDCRVIISQNHWKIYRRLFFNAHSNLLIVEGSFEGISVFRKVGDKID